MRMPDQLLQQVYGVNGCKSVQELAPFVKVCLIPTITTESP